jgi:hypothetical protein
MKKNNIKEIPQFEKGWNLINGHYLLGSIANCVYLQSNDSLFRIDGWNKNSIAYLKVVSNNQAYLSINKNKKYNEEQYLFVYSVLMIILAFQLYEKINNVELSPA